MLQCASLMRPNENVFDLESLFLRETQQVLMAFFIMLSLTESNSSQTARVRWEITETNTKCQCQRISNSIIK